MKLEREGIVFEPRDDIKLIFNPGAIQHKDRIYLLPRIIKRDKYDKYISEIWIAESRNGKNFKLLGPLIKPDKPYDKLGCEDARIIKLDKEYFITYTTLSHPACSGKGRRIGLVTTKDFKTIIKHGVIGPDRNDKNCVIFPEKTGGKIALLHRIKFDIYMMYFNNIEQLKKNYNKKFWEKYLGESNKYLVLKRKFEWESKKIGAGPPPIKTKEGWLLVYHGVDKNKIYRISAALLELSNPQKVIARSLKPILEPKLSYEKKGDVPNVIFPTGTIVKSRKLFIYYGAADKRCCLVSCNLDDLVSYLLKQN
jgi:predicted GH43/DUF377 family glycosyl hydrolase